MTRICAIVLNYRNWPDTLDVVKSLESQTTQPDHVLVVDNSSGGNEVSAMLRASTNRFEVLALTRNDGYAAGMNAGIAEVLQRGADMVLLLTHDAQLEPTCLERLAEELVQNPRAGVAAPVLGWKGRNGVTWSAGGTLTTLTCTPHHPDKGAPLKDVVRAPTRSVKWADGAVLLVRREVFDELGLLPEEYFLYFEEVDFQARVRRSGRAVRLVSSALAWQAPGHTPRYLAARNQTLWLRSGQPRALPFFLITTASSCLREIAKWVLGRTPDLSMVRAVVFGVVDGMSGRLRRELLALG